MRWRSLLVLVVLSAAVLGTSLMPAGAAAPLSVTHVKNWGSNGLEDGQFSNPAGVAVDKWGTVYVAGGENQDHRVQRFDSDGTFLSAVGTTVTGSTLLEKPRAVATDRWGYVYVAEKGNGGRVSKFFPDLYGGTHAGTWSGTDPEPVRMDNLVAIAVALDGSVFTIENSQWVQQWSAWGDHRTSWGAGGWAVSVASSQDGTVYATNWLGAPHPHTVGAFTPWGGLLNRWGGEGSADGQFDSPYGVSVDGGGNVFVVEAGGMRGQVFTSTGDHLATFGSPGIEEDQFSTVYGVAAGPDRTVYVADTFNHRISKWAVEVPTSIVEVAGSNRYATAKAASQKAYPSPGQSEYAVIATGSNWPDALGGAALAGALKAPLLLTTPGSLSPEVSAEIKRLNVQKIYVLGGESAVTPAVYNALAKLVGPGDIKRLGGSNRYETANRIAREVVSVPGSAYDGTAFVVTGRSFPDALAVSPIAAANGWPILLTEPAKLPATVKTTMQNIGANRGYIIGGESAVSAAVENELNDAFIDFGRYGGTNRYSTAAIVAGVGFDGMGMLWSRPAIATGEDFPDALAGGVLQGSDYSVMLLTPSGTLHEAAAAALKANSSRIYELRFLGGTTALSAQVRKSAAALVP